MPGTELSKSMKHFSEKSEDRCFIQVCPQSSLNTMPGEELVYTDNFF
jgi:hypothetical protein